MLFLDSDVLIDHLRGRRPVVEFLAEHEARGEEFAVASVTVAEVRRGVENAPNPARDLQRFNELLREVVEVPFGPAAGRRYGAVMAGLDRDGRPLDAMDGLIAATVLENGGRIATRNARHFRRVPGLLVVSP